MRKYAADELPEYVVLGTTAEKGPPMIIEDKALRDSRQHVVRAALKALDEHPDIVAVVVGAYGDPARDILAELLDIPVVGIGQASIMEAERLSHRFGIATSTPKLAESISSLVAKTAKGKDTFVGTFFTKSDPIALSRDPERQYAELREAVNLCVSHGAEAVIIGGGPLSDSARKLRTLDATQIIEPIPAACAIVRRLLADISVQTQALR